MTAREPTRRCSGPGCSSTALIKAHIMPAGFARVMHREGGYNLGLSHEGAHRSRYQLGNFDKGILCGDCDRLLGQLDGFALAFSRSNLPRFAAGTIGTIPNIDCDRLVAFATSVVWRASISAHPSFAKVDLGPLADRARDVAFGLEAEPFPVVANRLVSPRYDVREFYVEPSSAQPSRSLQFKNIVIGRSTDKLTTARQNRQVRGSAMEGSTSSGRLSVAWEARRDRRITHVRAVMAALSSIGLVLLLFGPGTWTGGYLPAEAADKIKDVLGPFRAIVPPRVIAAAPIWLLIGIVGWAIGWKAWKSAAKGFVDRFLAEFDERVLTRVAGAKPFDPFWGTSGEPNRAPLPWDPPVDGGRRTVWDGLLEFVRAEGGEGSNGWRRHNRKATTFRWLLVAGVPGMGKSRFALEVAQRLQDRRPGWRAELGVWARTTLPFLTPRLSDPFDCGWLCPFADDVATTDATRAYGAWLNRREAVGSWLTALEAWRPRRPTILLLDDPLIGSAAKIIETVSNSQDHYLWPVRLIIIHPTVPLELGMSATQTTSPRSTKPHFAGQIFYLGLDPGMSGLEINAVRNRLSDGSRLLSGAPAMQQFRASTRGIPLFVELGFDWLRRGLLLSDMTATELIEHRAERLVEAFKAAGLTEGDHFLAVACATIAGGGSREVIEKSYAKLPLAIAARHQLFPSDADDLATTIPPVRPRAVGAAFVRRVLRDYGPADSDARHLVTTAWAANPLQTLKSVLHLGQAEDALGRALAGEVPQAVLDEIGSVEIALAFAERAIQIPREAWLAEDYPKTSGLVAPTLSFIEAAPPQNLDDALERFLALGEPETALVRGNVFHNIFSAVVARAADARTDKAQPADIGRFFGMWHRWIAVLARWGTHLDNTNMPGIEGLTHRLGSAFNHQADADSRLQFFSALERTLDLVSRAKDPRSGYRPECCALCARIYEIQKFDPPSSGTLLHAKAMAIRARLIGDLPAMMEELDLLMTTALEIGDQEHIRFALSIAQDCLQNFPDDNEARDFVRVFGRYHAEGQPITAGMAMLVYVADMKDAAATADFAEAERVLARATEQALDAPSEMNLDPLAECYTLILGLADPHQLQLLRATLVPLWAQMAEGYGSATFAHLLAEAKIRTAIAKTAVRQGLRGIAIEESDRIEDLCFAKPGYVPVLYKLIEVLTVRLENTVSQALVNKMRFWLRLHSDDPSFAVHRLMATSFGVLTDEKFLELATAIEVADQMMESDDFRAAMSGSRYDALLAVFRMYHAYTLFMQQAGDDHLVATGLAGMERVNAMADESVEWFETGIRSVRAAQC